MSYRRVCSCDPPQTTGDCSVCGGRAAKRRRKPGPPPPARGAKGWKHLPGRFRSVVSRELRRLSDASKLGALSEDELARLDRLAAVTAKLTTVRVANDKLGEQGDTANTGGAKDVSEMSEAELAAAAAGN